MKWFPLLLVSGAACSWVKSSEVTPTPAPETAPTAEIVEMQATNVTRLYDATCAKCHGDRGQGGGGGTASLLTKEKFDQKYDKPYFDAIKNGVPESGMEAYGQTNSDQEIWGLVVHIRELQQAALRAAGERPKATGGVYSARDHKYKIETVIDRGVGLTTPWGIDWLPDGRALVTNKTGSISVIRDNQILGDVSGLPSVNSNGQAGLMDVAVHPKYSTNGWIYLSFSDIGTDNPRNSFTKIVRGKLEWSGASAKWVKQETIYEAPQSMYSGGGVHFGNRTVFDGKGHIYVAYGERGRGELSQDLSRTNGKVLRLNEDGTIPKDNPFVDQPGAVKAIWSYGHRNPQGLVLGLDGTLWNTEHGPRGGDELNKVVRGANYGWPLVAFSINYNDSPLSVPWPKPEQNITLPVLRWLPSIAACGLDVVKGAAFPKWRGDLVAGGLAGQTVIRVRVKDGKYVEQEEILFGMGRVRDVATSPKGEIFVLLNGPDMIVKLVPAN